MIPLCSSEVPFPNEGRRREGKPEVVPKAMTLADMARVKEEYKKAAERAKRVGFDGIEMHCGYGYLLDSFLRDGINKRTDNYGGSIENRARFPLEVLDVLINEFGAKRLGVKLSLRNDYNGMKESDPDSVLAYFIDRLNER